MIAKLYGAIKIRKAGLTLKILNMDVLFTPEQYSTVVDLDITQTIYTREDAYKLEEAAKEQGKQVNVFIKVDTGCAQREKQTRSYLRRESLIASRARTTIFDSQR